jgi:hypothetical protein
MSVVLSEIIPLVADYSRNQNLSTPRAIRAINTSVALLKRQFGIPSFERQYQFNFFDDQNFYSQPSDFSEPLNLRFDDEKYNESRRFTYKPSELLHERVVALDFDTLLWGHDTSTGALRAVVIAKNSNSGVYIDSMESNNALNWVVADDAANIRDDQFFQYGDIGDTGALEYDVNVALSGANRATIYSSPSSGPYDFSECLDTGWFRVYHYIPNITNYTSVSINISSDASYGTVANYSKITVTTQADGSPFVVGTNILAFSLAGLTQIGTPNYAAIDLIWLQDNYTAGYVSTPDFRYADLVLKIPDLMDESYYTKYKGTLADGTTPVVNFSLATDILGFGLMGDDDLMELVALQAAVLINPAILVSDKSVSTAYANFTKTFQRQYPKKRLNNLLAEPKTAKTSRSR